MSNYSLAIGARPRTSAYRMTVTTLDDRSLHALKQSVALSNKQRSLYNRKARKNGWASYDNMERVVVRPRGPRDGNIYDTPKANAERYDVYVRTVYRY